MNLGPANPLECLPRGWASTSYFSPGICPSGYVIAAKSTAQAGSAVETRATCCPVYVDPVFRAKEGFRLIVCSGGRETRTPRDHPARGHGRGIRVKFANGLQNRI